MTDPLRIFAAGSLRPAFERLARANAWVDGLAAPWTLAIMRGAGFAPAPLT